MSTQLAARETEDGRLALTQFSSALGRGDMVQIDGPNIRRPGEIHWITLRPEDALWLGEKLVAWGKEKAT